MGQRVFQVGDRVQIVDGKGAVKVYNGSYGIIVSKSGVMYHHCVDIGWTRVCFMADEITLDKRWVINKILNEL